MSVPTVNEITAEDIRPDTDGLEAMEKALKEMALCKEIFSKCSENLDR